MEIKIQNGETTTVALTGQLDTLTTVDAEKAISPILASDVKELVLDCSGLDYISSAGLRLLLIIQKRMASKKGIFRLVNTKKEVREIFDIFDLTGFSSILTIE